MYSWGSSDGPQRPLRRIGQVALAHAAVIGFVMLQAKVRHVIAQGEQEVILAVVPRSVERTGFGHQIVKGLGLLRLDLQSGCRVCGDVEFVRRTLAPPAAESSSCTAPSAPANPPAWSATPAQTQPSPGALEECGSALAHCQLAGSFSEAFTPTSSEPYPFG